jgi:xyloglucan 6-xylosyltransferase
MECCLRSMECAVNFADNQVLRLYGFQHQSIINPKVRRLTNRLDNPLEAKEAALKLDARFDS